MASRLLCILWGIAMAQTARGGASDLAPMVGQPADIAPSAYLYRQDRAPAENPPETEILFSALPHKKAGVLCGLLWEEPRPVSRVELLWPADAKRIPSPGAVALRWLPHGDSSSWWSRRGGEMRTVANPEASADGRTWVYTVDAARQDGAMDNLVVALRDGAEAPPEGYATPAVRVLTPQTWKLVDLEIEWGFQAGREKPPSEGTVEVYNGILGRTRPLADGGLPAGGPRHGFAVSVLYLGSTLNTPVWRQHARLEDANRTIVTVRAGAGGFSFLPADLESGPILAPEHGFFVRATARHKAVAATPTTGAAAPAGLLTEKVDAIAGSPAIRGWGSNATPWFGGNPGETPVTAGTFTLPARCVAMHPGPTRPVAVAWRSPIKGSVSVKGKVAGADTKGGNGIEWWLTLEARAGARTLATGATERGGTQAVAAGEAPGLSVEPGDLVSLVIGPKGDHSFDTTVVELAIAEAGGKARVWDLTKDLVDSVQAANPHPDSLGHAAVWHFYSPEQVPQTEAAAAVFASKAASAREFEKELAARGPQTIRQRVREHAEQTWEGAMQALHPGGNWPPYPKPDFEPPAQIDVPDTRLTDAWRCGAWHLLRVLKKDAHGRYIHRDFPYDALAHETFLILRALDLQGMHQAARDGLARWLERDEKQPTKMDGLFADTVGAMSGVEWDWQHGGGPGVMQWQMVEHYRLTGDRDWFARAAPKLQANADWMIRQRHAYLKDVPGRDRLWIHGLLPPHNIWDSTNWRPWYESNANYWFGLRRYAEAIADLDPELGSKYAAEADAYARDILAAVDKSFTLSPVVRVRDGTYRSFLPPTPYMRGPASRCIPTSFGPAEHTPGLYPDAIRGGVHLINLSGLLPASDPRAQGLVDVLEDRLLLEHHRLPMRTPGYDPEKHWFSHAGWYYQCGIERTANVHLQWDDAPNFLRSFYNQYAVDIVVGPYTFNEHTTRGPEDKSFEEAAFLDRLRNMLVMEEGDALWLARATPRAWLAQGKRIALRNMPTHFGAVACEIISDADHGRITATIECPARRAPKALLLRLRHPAAAPIRGATVNTQAWNDFDAGKELIRLHGVGGTVHVEVQY
ncbi:MAG TPA: hypothetical protein PLE19_16055 [Planctomycetota bacterium]|nr:hypothetical protein [Planctomycetota bacterium]HRR80021.1 hypothetical protein [Planctomycetota bacterium]HRT96658.1 hypothetical protein [Planctomycetota bacterium]